MTTPIDSWNPDQTVRYSDHRTRDMYGVTVWSDECWIAEFAEWMRIFTADNLPLFFYHPPCCFNVEATLQRWIAEVVMIIIVMVIMVVYVVVTKLVSNAFFFLYYARIIELAIMMWQFWNLTNHGNFPQDASWGYADCKIISHHEVKVSKEYKYLREHSQNSKWCSTFKNLLAGLIKSEKKIS